MRIFRAGIYEYDKPPRAKASRPCAECGKPITNTGNKKRCSSCSDKQRRETIAAYGRKARARLKGAQE